MNDDRDELNSRTVYDFIACCLTLAAALLVALIALLHAVGVL